MYNSVILLVVSRVCKEGKADFSELTVSLKVSPTAQRSVIEYRFGLKLGLVLGFSVRAMVRVRV